MISIEIINSCFKEIIQKGFRVVRGLEKFYLLNDTESVLIKVVNLEIDNQIAAYTLKSESCNFSNHETITSLDEFEIDFSYRIDVSNWDFKDGLYQLKKVILHTEGLMILGEELVATFSRYCQDTITPYDFKISSQKFGSMTEKMYLWNRRFILEITRDYDEGFLNTAVYKYTNNGDYLIPEKVIPLGLLVDKEEMIFTSSRCLNDRGQKSFFSQLRIILISQIDKINENIERDDVDWRVMQAGPAKASWIKIN